MSRPRCDWPAVLADAKARDLSTGQVAREQGCPYGTVATAAQRLGIKLRTDDRKRRWDGIRIADRYKALKNFSYSPLCDLAQNERLAPALSNASADTRPMVGPDTVYVIEEEGGAWCKIGISSSNDIDRRLRELRLGNPRELMLAFTAQVPHPRLTERAIHSRLWQKRAGGRVRTEWFAVGRAEAIATVRCVIEGEQR